VRVLCVVRASHRRFIAAVVGIDRYPRKITRAMGKAKTQKRSAIKPFIKVFNYTHLMPTRFVALSCRSRHCFMSLTLVAPHALGSCSYQVDITDKLKKVITEEAYTDPAARHTARKEVKAILQQRCVSVHVSPVCLCARSHRAPCLISASTTSPR